MNAYLAEIIATERIAELRRDAERARLVTLVRRRPDAIATGPVPTRRSRTTVVVHRLGLRTW
jgi:hypothetical protein